MDVKRTFSRRLALTTAILMLVMLVLIDSVIYLGVIVFYEKVSLLSQSYPEIRDLADQIGAIRTNLQFYGIPISIGIFAVLGFLFWYFSRFSLMKPSNKTAFNDGKKPETSVDKPVFEKKEKEDNDRRLYLYLLSVMQREGRLLDFFSENLSSYEDAQIGAAVRSIHENCKKVIDKYLPLKAVTNEMEGESMTVGPDFDSSAIKLTGNVTGEPPFKGIVRHRGWRVKRLDLPTFSSRRNPNIITPAEVEIP
jgi:hypothetical protein